MRRILAFLTTLTLVLGAGFFTAPADAHTSTYCGHGTSGTLYETSFLYSWNQTFNGVTWHYHRYGHVDNVPPFDAYHETTRACG